MSQSPILFYFFRKSISSSPNLSCFCTSGFCIIGFKSSKSLMTLFVEQWTIFAYFFAMLFLFSIFWLLSQILRTLLGGSYFVNPGFGAFFAYEIPALWNIF